jgi:catechol 2,3-dioxygenase-like lactoylglutathione lyase family enzyme
MLGARSVTAFVATTDPARARAFYEGTLGLSLVSDEPWALVFSAAGTMLRVQKVERHTPHPFTALGWSAPAHAPNSSRAMWNDAGSVARRRRPESSSGLS